jgi:hypothetical protein
MPRQEINTHHGRISQGRDPVNPRQWRQAYVHGKFRDVRSGRSPEIEDRAGDSLLTGSSNIEMDSLCDPTGRPILMSQRFAQLLAKPDVVRIGNYTLKGLSEPMDVVAPARS